MIRLDKDEALDRLREESVLDAPFGGCVMCRLASPSNAHAFIGESEHGALLLDGYGATHGHLLVVAKRHVERASSIEWPVYADLQQLAWNATRLLETELLPGRVYVAALGANQSLPMSFPHFHLHVVPVYDDDEAARPARVFSWSSGVVCYEGEEARQLSSRLRGAFAALVSVVGLPPGVHSASPALATRN